MFDPETPLISYQKHLLTLKIDPVAPDVVLDLAGGTGIGSTFTCQGGRGSRSVSTLASFRWYNDSTGLLIGAASELTVSSHFATKGIN